VAPINPSTFPLKTMSKQMQHQKRRPKGKIKWNKHKKRLQRFPCRDSTVLQMSTRSKKLVPSSPSMSTRSKRGLSLWFQLETSSKCFVSNFMTVWPNVHICMYACVNLTICMCEPTHVWTCCELKVHICMCRPCCGMYVCMYQSNYGRLFYQFHAKEHDLCTYLVCE